jgi:hypothetical protein
MVRTIFCALNRARRRISTIQNLRFLHHFQIRNSQSQQSNPRRIQEFNAPFLVHRQAFRWGLNN